MKDYEKKAKELFESDKSFAYAVARYCTQKDWEYRVKDALGDCTDLSVEITPEIISAIAIKAKEKFDIAEPSEPYWSAIDEAIDAYFKEVN